MELTPDYAAVFYGAGSSFFLLWFNNEHPRKPKYACLLQRSQTGRMTVLAAPICFKRFVRGSLRYFLGGKMSYLDKMRPFRSPLTEGKPSV